MDAAAQWAEIETAYAAPPVDEKQNPNLAQVLEAQENKAPPLSLQEKTAHFVSALLRDASRVTAHASSPWQWLDGMWVVLTYGDRGLILGTVLLIIALTGLLLVPPSRSHGAQQANGSTSAVATHATQVPQPAQPQPMHPQEANGGISTPGNAPERTLATHVQSG